MAFLWRAAGPAGPAQALAKHRIRLTVKRTEQKAFILSTLDSFCALWRSRSNPFLVYGLFTKRDIYKYFATKNSFAPQMLSIPSRVPADSRFSSFLLSRDIRRFAATLTFASPRTHRSGNSRERIVFVCRSLISRSLRATNFATCFIHLWKYFSNVDKKEELRAFCIILSLALK